jgi:Family of unknown function (DUF5906)
MSQAMWDFCKRYIYIIDEDCFYDTKRKQNVEHSVMGQRAAKISAPEKISGLIESIKMSGVTRDNLRIAKPSIHAVIDAAYQNLKPHLAFRTTFVRNIPLMYLIKDSGECTFAGSLDTDNFLAQISNHKPLLEAISDEYYNSTVISSKMDLTSFVGALFRRFQLDSETRLAEEPQLISWSKDEPAFRVLDPSVLQADDHPNWDSFLERVEHPETFKAYVWSIFEPKNKGRQALWIRGEGMDGKSSAVNAIASFLGRAHVLSIGVKSYESDFFFGAAFAKRLAIYMDCNNLQVLRKERIKSLLGGDTVDINNKYEKTFSAKIHSKLIVLSNFPPHINYNDNSERTRLLYTTVRTYKDQYGDPNFESNLLAELPAFLVTCREAYELECPTGAELKVPLSMQETIRIHCSALDSDLVEEFITERLEFGPQFFVRKTELSNALKEYFSKNWATQMSGFSFENLVRILQQNDIKEGKAGQDFKSRAYLGVRLKGSKNIL